MEFIFKVVITVLVLCLIYFQLLFIRAVWKSQIDPAATFTRLLGKLKPEVEVIATRDPNKIYQGGEVVGEVRGEVKRDVHRVSFTSLVNTTGLDPDAPFEYQRMRLRILSRGSRTGQVIDMTDKGTFTYRDVLENVQCEVLQ